MDPFFLKSGLNLGPGEERQACLSGAQVSVVLFLIAGTEKIYLSIYPRRDYCRILNFRRQNKEIYTDLKNFQKHV